MVNFCLDGFQHLLLLLLLLLLLKAKNRTLQGLFDDCLHLWMHNWVACQPPLTIYLNVFKFCPLIDSHKPTNCKDDGLRSWI